MHSGRVCFDSEIPFAKATGMNRYRLSGSQGAIMISLPIQGWRSHPQPLGQVRLATEQGRSGGGWAKTHWRSIQNAYRRAPFFEYLEDDLSKQILETGELLMEYNLKILTWLINRLSLDVQITESAGMRPLSQPWVLIRKEKNWNTPRYFQHFEAQTRFIPGLSVLDLLIQCGPHESKAYLERFLSLNASNFNAHP
ncbi:MAG: hypothetical protein RLZZ617_1199 [Bacteroidota bacterium]